MDVSGMILELRRELDRIERSIAILEGITRVALGHEPAKHWLVHVKGAEHPCTPRRTKVIPIHALRNSTNDS